ncbi:MAG: c-type cytochrome [Alphaproteobacteria bacterium]
MKNLLAVTAFGLLTIGFFTWFSNFGIPEVKPSPPPKEEQLELGAMGMDQFIALGERIFNGKGTCTLCHNPVGARAPLLEKVGESVRERLADARYTGKATDVESYLYESMVDPSAFVVAGFGKTGTNDTVSPMPNVATGSVGLKDAEIKAVIAYLQKASGLEVTVKIPSDVAEISEEAPAEAARKPVGTPQEAIAEFGCAACHKVGGGEADLGPDLTRIGRLRDKAYIRRSILDPNADISQGFQRDTMPGDYGTQMYAKELEMLVDYLARLK